MLFKYMQDGGPAIMWPIAALSWIALMFTLERAFWWARFFLRRDPQTRRDAVDGRLSADHAPTENRDPVAEVAQWFRHDPRRGKLMADRLVAESRRWNTLLECIASLSTSLGLFGTVVGVSMSFDSMAAGKSDDVAHGLSVALYTTVAGLINYLYCFMASSLFRHLSDGLEDDLDRAAAAIELQQRAPEPRPAAPVYNVISPLPVREAQLMAGGRA